MSTLIQDFLQNTADRLPNKVAIICAGKRLTYAEVEAAANRLAHALIERGVQRGDRVLVFLPNSIELAISVFAILKADATFVVVNETTKANKLTFIATNSESIALITDTRKASIIHEIAPDVPLLRHFILCGKNADEQTAGKANWETFDNIQATYPTHRPIMRSIDRDLACLIYTSGSTGEPKGVICDHSNMVFVSDSVISYLQNVQDDVLVCVLSMAFSYGLYQLFMAFRVGGTILIERGFTFPAAVLKNMQKERVTGFALVPTIIATLLKTDLSRYDLSHLRYVTNAAAPLSPTHIQAFNERLPQTTIYSMYGLTETKRALYLPPEQLTIRPDSVGIAIPGTEVWLEDEDGNRLGPGETGELVIRGRHVMRGYWRAPEATAARYREGIFPGERVCYSGDLFRMDEEGFYYFVSRKDDIIKSRGEKVAPKEVENVVYQLPSVSEATVIGVDDEVIGQAVKLFVVPKDDSLTEKEILAHCRQHLEDYMVPKYVEFRAELPKTPSGKIIKRVLS